MHRKKYIIFRKRTKNSGTAIRLSLIHIYLDFTKWEPILPLGIRDLQAIIGTEPIDAVDKYCLLYTSGTKVKIEVDFGQKAKWATPNARFLVDENGEQMNFNSMIDAVNYLAKLGWELILAT